MIKIKISSANGAEARQELLALLGLSSDAVIVPQTKAEIDLKVAETAEVIGTALEMQNQLAESRQPEKPKRRTRAEIEAEKNAAVQPAQDEKPADEEQAPADEAAAGEEETPATEPPITAKELQDLCIDLGRAGKRDEVKGLISKEFPGQSISGTGETTKIAEEDYPKLKAGLIALKEGK